MGKLRGRRPRRGCGAGSLLLALALLCLDVNAEAWTVKDRVDEFGDRIGGKYLMASTQSDVAQTCLLSIGRVGDSAVLRCSYFNLTGAKNLPGLPNYRYWDVPVKIGDVRSEETLGRLASGDGGMFVSDTFVRRLLDAPPGAVLSIALPY